MQNILFVRHLDPLELVDSSRMQMSSSQGKKVICSRVWKNLAFRGKIENVGDGCKYYSALAESIWAIPQDFTFTAYKFSQLIFDQNSLAQSFFNIFWPTFFVENNAG